MAKLILPNDERWQALHNLVFGTRGLDNKAPPEGGADNLPCNLARLQIDASHHALTFSRHSPRIVLFRDLIKVLFSRLPFSSTDAAKLFVRQKCSRAARAVTKA
ncbi:hypothetical protein NKJ64_21990 [Mesorhizobium sp. M0062]